MVASKNSVQKNYSDIGIFNIGTLEQSVIFIQHQQ